MTLKNGFYIKKPQPPLSATGAMDSLLSRLVVIATTEFIPHEDRTFELIFEIGESAGGMRDEDGLGTVGFRKRGQGIQVLDQTEDLHDPTIIHSFGSFLDLLPRVMNALGNLSTLIGD